MLSDQGTIYTAGIFDEKKFAKSVSLLNTSKVYSYDALPFNLSKADKMSTSCCIHSRFNT